MVRARIPEVPPKFSIGFSRGAGDSPVATLTLAVYVCLFPSFRSDIVEDASQPQVYAGNFKSSRQEEGECSKGCCDSGEEMVITKPAAGRVRTDIRYRKEKAKRDVNLRAFLSKKWWKAVLYERRPAEEREYHILYLKELYSIEGKEHLLVN